MERVKINALLRQKRRRQSPSSRLDRLSSLPVELHHLIREQVQSSGHGILILGRLNRRIRSIHVRAIFSHIKIPLLLGSYPDRSTSNLLQCKGWIRDPSNAFPIQHLPFIRGLTLDILSSSNLLKRYRQIPLRWYQYSDNEFIFSKISDEEFSKILNEILEILKDNIQELTINVFCKWPNLREAFKVLSNFKFERLYRLKKFKFPLMDQFLLNRNCLESLSKVVLNFEGFQIVKLSIPCFTSPIFKDLIQHISNQFVHLRHLTLHIPSCQLWEGQRDLVWPSNLEELNFDIQGIFKVIWIGCISDAIKSSRQTLRSSTFYINGSISFPTIPQPTNFMEFSFDLKIFETLKFELIHCQSTTIFLILKIFKSSTIKSIHFEYGNITTDVLHLDSNRELKQLVKWQFGDHPTIKIQHRQPDTWDQYENKKLSFFRIQKFRNRFGKSKPRILHRI